MNGGDPRALEASVIEINHQVHPTVEAFRHVGESQEGNGCMDGVTDELVSKSPHLFMESAHERARQETLHQAIGDALASG